MRMLVLILVGFTDCGHRNPSTAVRASREV